MKATKGAVGHLCKHYERGFDNNGELVKFGNQSIDNNRSHLNYNLAPQRDISQGEFIKQRCNEVYCLNRKDVNVMCSWVVTMPKDLPEHLEQDFFKETYKFLSERYGKENIISAWVHKDEVTPHLHFSFVPVTYDQKKERYKVSAYEVINKTELQRFHPELQKHLENALGCPVNVLNEATKEGNKSIEELKRGTAQTELAQIKAEMQPYKDLKIEAEKISEEVKKVPRLPFTKQKIQVSEETWNKVYNQSLAYAANVDDVNFARTNKQKVIEKALKLKERKKSLDIQEKKLAEKTERQANLNELLEKAESKIKNLEFKYSALNEIKNSYKEKNKILQEQVEEGFSKLTAIAKAVGMLKYDNGDYKAELTKKQETLVDAISNYAAKANRDYGFEENADDIDKHIDISDGIKSEIKKIEPKRHRSYER